MGKQYFKRLKTIKNHFIGSLKGLIAPLKGLIAPQILVKLRLHKGYAFWSVVWGVNCYSVCNTPKIFVK